MQHPVDRPGQEFFGIDVVHVVFPDDGEDIRKGL